MSQPDSDRSSSDSSRRILSALADGDATDGEAARAFQAWRDEPDARAAWHSYQLIGDVLRSEDLACEPAAIATGPCQRLRERIAPPDAFALAGNAIGTSSTRGCGASTTGSSARRARSAARKAASAAGSAARSSLRSTSPISW